MAHKSAPNSGSCQFYFSLDEQPEFDDKYTVFGQATEGLEVIEQLAIGDAIKGIVIEGADEEALAEAIAQDTPRPPTPQEALAAIEAERAERALPRPQSRLRRSRSSHGQQKPQTVVARNSGGFWSKNS